jgi:oligoendopeptidase F
MALMHPKLVEKPERHYLPADLSFDSWDNLAPFFGELVEREVVSVSGLLKWLHDVNEMDAAFDEELAWRYIRSTCDTTNEDYEKAYDFFVSEIEPHAATLFNDLNRKLDNSAFKNELDKKLFTVYLRTVHNDIAIFRENNIALFTEIDQLKQQYGKIVGDMTVEIDGKELTLQQAGVYLRNTERGIRETTSLKIWNRRIRDKETLDNLFDKLTALRQNVARNAGFSDFRDYSFAAMGRFDYTKEDCFLFHDAVAHEVVPFTRALDEERREKLGLETLRHWDLEVDVDGKPALKPFENGSELVEKTIACMKLIRPAYAEYISIMRDMGHFDLDSRKGKAPGGYNYSLAETGVPFIFMNSAGTHRDLITIVHEAGHAIHSFLENHLPLNVLKSPPSEVCELASMSMELISMEHWHVFYPDKDELNRARREQLERALATLPWVAQVDAFQHWIYENPEHTYTQRSAAWMKLMDRFESNVDWSGIEIFRENAWQKQLHIYETPFYYIEYGMAQLGAIAVWRNYLADPEKALDQYEAALKLGYTQPIGKLYEAAGIKFDFSREYVRELVEFVRMQLEKLD